MNSGLKIISMSDGRDWLDLTVIAVSIISPILVLISVVFAAKSARAAEKATNLNLEMYNEQKLEQEKAYYPIFEVLGHNENPSESLRIRLLNRNTVPITNVRGHVETGQSLFKYNNKTGVIDFLLFQNFNEDVTAEFKLDYVALNHHSYTCNLRFSFLEGELFLDSQENIKIN